MARAKKTDPAESPVAAAVEAVEAVNIFGEKMICEEGRNSVVEAGFIQRS